MTSRVDDRAEQRRFVGREFLLFLWFESEAFEATLATARHGSFGLWIERLFVLSVGVEATRIRGSLPARSRESKEALALGKLPESAGIHVSLGDREIAFTLKADLLAISGLKLPEVLGSGGGDDDDAAATLLPPRRGRRPGKPPGERDEEAAASFQERMRLTREVEEVVEALYRDFLTLRLGPAWDTLVVPALHSWVAADGKLDADRYRAARRAALGEPGRRPSRRSPSAKSVVK